ncbi:MAG TPA: YggT family protein [Roseiflexaceae bacterium]|nr:YggT family protein [Roseiflexaceae bacterium]HMP39639.1 YggT family protein [Roseiflexaceae bacterium]
MRFLPVFLYCVGACEGLLLARLIVRLFAGRPDNAAFALLSTLTAPLIMPFGVLDAAQPQFGAVLEFATLAAMIAGGIVVAIGARRLRRYDSRARNR